MPLHPCGHCLRHFFANEMSCPFCLTPSKLMAAGSLALAACGGSPPSTTQTELPTAIESTGSEAAAEPALQPAAEPTTADTPIDEPEVGIAPAEPDPETSSPGDDRPVAPEPNPPTTGQNWDDGPRDEPLYGVSDY